VGINDGSEWVDLSISWAGGSETRTKMRRPVGRFTELGEHKQLLEEIWRLRGDGYTARQIADRLNAHGWTTATQRNSFNDRLVRMLLHRYGTVTKGARRPPNDDPNDWWLADLADEIEVPLVTLYGWMKRGWVKARRIDGRWAVRANADERRRLCRLRRKHPSPQRAEARTHH
jgi:hypothetical protein